ncbi:MAG: phenylacetate-CoA oxygenase subunit PaaJ [Anaerolineales bacterium]|nr:phenylacetate-CoA oxygenase subunit PaaJ [Anaerolineales bacterium]
MSKPAATRPSEAEIWEALSQVPDPEMPFVNLVEMGIVRELGWQGGRLQVTITPTFAACPAYEVMQAEILAALAALGLAGAEVLVSHNPPWTSEWISAEARQKLKDAGLAPPPRHQGDLLGVLMDPVPCPRCGSEQTSLRNSFGTTPCRMIYTCNDCKEPFEMFKPL